MKKTIFTLLLLLGIGMGTSLLAQEAAANAAPEQNAEVDYESLMITVWDAAPEYQGSTPTYGIKIGILGCGGAQVCGVESAVISAGSDKVKGFKGSLIYTVGKEATGVVTAPFNFVDEVHGLEVAIVNVAEKGGVQIGLLNFMKNGFLPCFPLINFGL